MISEADRPMFELFGAAAINECRKMQGAHVLINHGGTLLMSDLHLREINGYLV